MAIEWRCEKHGVQPGELRAVTKPLAPGQDPPVSNPPCPICGKKMMPGMKE
jgi:hypothetical protein